MCPNETLYERLLPISDERIHYISSVVEPFIRNATERSCALTACSAKLICMHSGGDAENLIKNIDVAVHTVISLFHLLLDSLPNTNIEQAR